MKFYKITILLFFFALVSCNENRSLEMYMHSFQKTKTAKVRLDIKKENQNKHYHYHKKNDTIKDLKLIYNLEKNVLITDKDTFYPIQKTYSTKDLEYEMYQLKTVKSHNRTLVFNKNYGLLISSALGADFLFLKDSLSVFDNEEIFKLIMLEKNKIKLQ